MAQNTGELVWVVGAEGLCSRNVLCKGRQSAHSNHSVQIRFQARRFWAHPRVVHGGQN